MTSKKRLSFPISAHVHTCLIVMLELHTTYRWNVKKREIKAGLKCSIMAKNTIKQKIKTKLKD